jgi:5,10-methylenetetrahydromethanopterin reductase
LALEFWRVGQTSPRTIAEDAPRSEADGWDGMLIADSQCVIGDSYVALAIAAASTSRLRLGIGVGNPVTRHPSVTASAAAGIQQFSGGRMVLGLGRGDSSLAHIGLAPASPKVFESYLRAVQGYLAGRAVAFGDLDRGSHRRLETLGAAGVPEASTLRWLDPAVPKVPVDVAASGPAVIGIAARHADRMTFGVGADPDRLRWAVESARAARVEAGLDPAGISLGAYINVVAHTDERTAVGLAGSAVAMFSRFSIMHGRTTGPMSDAAKGTLTKVREQYDLREHGRPDARHGASVDSAHVRSFGVVGTPQHVAERLVQLHDLGLSRVMILGGLADSTGQAGEDLAVSRKLLTSQIMPAVRAALAAR